MSARPAPRRVRAADPRPVRPPRPAAASAPPEDALGAARPLGGVLLAVPSWLVSMVVHMALLMVLAVWIVPERVAPRFAGIVALPPEADVFDDPAPDVPWDPPRILDLTVIEPVALPDASPASPEVSDVDEPSPWEDMEEPVLGVRWDQGGPMQKGQGGPPGGIGRRTDENYKRRVTPPRVQHAVALALKWLAEHQMPDGGWSFNHAACPACRGQCRNPGELAEARVAATALALLPFLGAGQTHKEGQYKKTVRQGLYFLVAHMRVSPQGGSLCEPGGRMYGHGIAAIALCEAHAMTHDRGLFQPAQQAVNFIAYAQDPVGGGWRYEPRQPGDTSVVGWQIMALKSGHLGYLRVPPVTVKKAFQFLDHVQANSGANYGYTDPGAGKATTAIGLLCRMHLGWPKDNPALARGVEWLSRQGPSPGDMYYNYYATQVLHHWGGAPWDQWDRVMREQLLKGQAAAGHETGSWFMPDGDHGARQGGRLYATAMAAMVLEVYYRHLRIYDSSWRSRSRIRGGMST